MFYNNDLVLPYWTREMLKVINHLGKENVYVSIVESYSTDNTPALLRSFDAQLAALGIERRIIVQDISVGRDPDVKETGQARVEYLAKIRNRVMEPLIEKGGYDRVLFSNDVFVEAESVVELLETNDGDWDMVCGTDFSVCGLYDNWVLRDRFGRLTSALWPYLFEDAGMQAVMNDEPAPVFSCWNGIVAFRAEPLLPLHLRTGQLSPAPLSRPLASTHPAYGQPADLSPALTPPLKFRGSYGKECFSSESLNFPYDMRRQFEMTKIYMNPRVITAYEWRYYFWFKFVTRHWLIKWWIKHVERGDSMHRAKILPGDSKKVWVWDGGECQYFSNLENQTLIDNEDSRKGDIYLIQ
ncbi:cryptococcal mannosyltransferase 1-domain-containing protein [Mycena floridula]|nr:cryptococcal mannosyltransferase 1-domain-containing protein [Mycena floridula]